MIIVTGHAIARQDTEAEVERLAVEHVLRSRAEPGCVSDEVSRDVLVNGMRLPKGKYALFTIPAEKSWTLVFNKESNQWGAYNYKESMDALRVNTTPKKAKAFSERLEFVITPKGKVFLNWENLTIPFVVKPL